MLIGMVPRSQRHSQPGTVLGGAEISVVSILIAAPLIVLIFEDSISVTKLFISNSDKFSFFLSIFYVLDVLFQLFDNSNVLRRRVKKVHSIIKNYISYNKNYDIFAKFYIFLIKKLHSIMSKSDSLFKLIHSLNRTEKAYFKKMATAFSDSSDNKTIQLFDILEKQREYDEDMVEKELNDKDYVKNLSRHKNYLFELVLRTQYNYHLKWSKVSEITHMSRCAELLIEKQLYKEAYKLIRSLKKEALLYEAYSQLYSLISLERKIPSVFHIIPTSESKMLKEQETALQFLHNSINYESLSSKIQPLWSRVAVTKSKPDTDELKQALKSPYLKNENEAFSVSAKINYNIILGGSYFALGDLNKSYVFGLRVINLFEGKKEMIKIKPGEYLNSIYNLFITQAELFRFEEMFNTMKRFFVFAEEPAIKKSKYFQSRIFEFTNYLSLVFYTRIGEFKRSLERCEYVEKHLADYDITPRYQLMLNYEMAYCYFITGNYRSSLRHLNKIIFSGFKNSDDLHSAQLLSLIVHFELANHSVIKSQLKAFDNGFKTFNDYRILLVQFIERDMKNVFKSNELAGELKRLYENSRAMVNSGDTNQKLIDLLDVLSWMESKINKVPMKTIIREKSIKRYGKIKLPA